MIYEILGKLVVGWFALMLVGGGFAFLVFNDIGGAGTRGRILAGWGLMLVGIFLLVMLFFGVPFAADASPAVR